MRKILLEKSKGIERELKDINGKLRGVKTDNMEPLEESQFIEKNARIKVQSALCVAKSKSITALFFAIFQIETVMVEIFAGQQEDSESLLRQILMKTQKGVKQWCIPVSEGNFSSPDPRTRLANLKKTLQLKVESYAQQGMALDQLGKSKHDKVSIALCKASIKDAEARLDTITKISKEIPYLEETFCNEKIDQLAKLLPARLSSILQEGYIIIEPSYSVSNSQGGQVITLEELELISKELQKQQQEPLYTQPSSAHTVVPMPISSPMPPAATPSIFKPYREDSAQIQTLSSSSPATSTHRPSTELPKISLSDRLIKLLDELFQRRVDGTIKQHAERLSQQFMGIYDEMGPERGLSEVARNRLNLERMSYGSLLHPPTDVYLSALKKLDKAMTLIHERQYTIIMEQQHQLYQQMMGTGPSS